MKRIAVGVGGLLAGLAVALGVFLWFQRAPSRQAPTLAESWSPGRIQANPAGYLAWALTECQATENRLTGARISLRNEVTRVERAITALGADERATAMLLDEATALYRRTSAAAAWPAELRGERLDEAALKNRIGDVNRRLLAIRELLRARHKSQSRMDEKNAEMDRRLDDLRQLKQRLSADAEIARMNGAVTGIESIAGQLAEIKATAELLVSSRSDTWSLDNLPTPPPETNAAAEFEKLVNPKGNP